jgi:hypothetical protein
MFTNEEINCIPEPFKEDVFSMVRNQMQNDITNAMLGQNGGLYRQHANTPEATVHGYLHRVCQKIAYAIAGRRGRDDEDLEDLVRVARILVEIQGRRTATAPDYTIIERMVRDMRVH